MMQRKFGREYSQLSRIYTEVENYMDSKHRYKVVGNVEWYMDRLDIYNDIINRKIASLAVNPEPGHVPVYLNDLFGMIDGSYQKIDRPHGHDNAQHPFYNGHMHMHCLNHLGLAFPDGLLVLEPAFLGYYTDTTVCHGGIAHS